MRFTVVALLLLTAMLATAKEKYEELDALEAQERKGLAYYGRGKYDRAFEVLKETAIRGFKDSQYTLSLMYLKGQHVSVDYVRGTAWLGVAAEAGVDDWVRGYESLMQALDPESRSQAEALHARLLARHGLVPQNVTCRKRASSGSHFSRVICQKGPGQYPLYRLE